MGSMNPLLNKTLKPFALYALLILGLSIPVYYLIVDYIWVNELDKHHAAVKSKIEKEVNDLQLSDSTFAQTMSIWNRINPGSTFRAVDVADIREDSTYTEIRFDDFQQDREQFRGLVTYIHINGKPYRLRVETNMEETDETVLAIAAITVVFFLLLLLGFVLLNRRLSLKIWRPFYGTLEQLRSFNLDGDKNITFVPTDIREFSELNGELERLIEKNVSVFGQQKEFTENASHELQTPLAIIKSKLDVLLQSQDLTEAQYETVEAINRSLTRAYRINRNLLLLARIENRQFPENENIQLTELLDDGLEILADHIDDKHIRIQKELHAYVSVTGNKTLVEILVNNLLLNAIRHNHPGGQMQVLLLPHLLAVSNSGHGPLDPDTLFKRFASASKETPGSGLGLAIVMQIVQRHGWKIDYRFEDSMHVFAVHF